MVQFSGPSLLNECSSSILLPSVHSSEHLHLTIRSEHKQFIPFSLSSSFNSTDHLHMDIQNIILYDLKSPVSKSLIILLRFDNLIGYLPNKRTYGYYYLNQRWEEWRQRREEAEI